MEELTLDMLLAKIRDNDANVRLAAMQAAGPIGAAALEPLAKIVTDGSLEVSRMALRAMWQIVRHVGRPGADAEKAQSVAKLLEMLADGQPVAIRREVLWMVSELGTDESVVPVAKLLGSPELREDARGALQRIPGDNAVAALRNAFGSASGDFRAALACALRARGVEVAEPPCPKLVPTKATSVKPVGR